MNLVFDIGCNVGNFSKAILKKYPNVQILAIDANEGFGKFYERSPSITFVNCLVSNKDNENIDFYSHSENTGISTASKEFLTNSRFAAGSKYVGGNSYAGIIPYKVPTITLDSLINHYGCPDLIKIDVEGYELEVLSGLTNKQNIIEFEWTEELKDNLIKCIHHLSGIGYNEFGIIGYFDEGDVFSRSTYTNEGDAYLLHPKQYFSLEEIVEEVEHICNPSRKVNYGMFFVK
jgi:FkbM family methyltransferase